MKFSNFSKSRNVATITTSSLFALIMVTSPALAASFKFSADNFKNNATSNPIIGEVIGAFSGEDLDGDGFIYFNRLGSETSEVTAFNLIWTDSSSPEGIEPFSLGFSDLEVLSYSLEAGVFSIRRPVERPWALLARNTQYQVGQDESIPFDPFTRSSVIKTDITPPKELVGDAFTVTPVPEPSSTLGLLALGTLGAGSALKRNKKQKKETTKGDISI